MTLYPLTSPAKVLTIGTFDLFHAGHASLLARAASFGELDVGVNTDEFVSSYKKQTPALPLADRLTTIAALPFVAKAWPNADNGRTLIRAVDPAIIVIGSDWHGRDYLAQIGVTQEELDEAGCALIYVPYTSFVSTSRLRKQLGI